MHHTIAELASEGCSGALVLFAMGLVGHRLGGGRGLIVRVEVVT